MTNYKIDHSVGEHFTFEHISFFGLEIQKFFIHKFRFRHSIYILRCQQDSYKYKMSVTQSRLITE